MARYSVLIDPSGRIYVIGVVRLEFAVGPAAGPFVERPGNPGTALDRLFPVPGHRLEQLATVGALIRIFFPAVGVVVDMVVERALIREGLVARSAGFDCHNIRPRPLWVIFQAERPVLWTCVGSPTVAARQAGESQKRRAQRRLSPCATSH